MVRRLGCVSLFAGSREKQYGGQQRTARTAMTNGLHGRRERIVTSDHSREAQIARMIRNSISLSGTFLAQADFKTGGSCGNS
jgi:hypothetical protein